MSKVEKLLVKLLRGASDGNFSFDELRTLILNLGFDERISSSHHIYTKEELTRSLIFSPNRVKQNHIR